MRTDKLIAATLLLPLGACTGMAGEIDQGVYSLVEVKSRTVGNGSIAVTPPRPWNKQRRIFWDSHQWVEDWTLNGPYLDSLMFITGLPDRKYLVRQRSTAERQVPMFRSNMTAPEVTAMLESAFRVRAGAIDFRTLGLQPRQFLGYPGFQFDFEHLDSDELWRRGRAVGAIIDGRLYLVLYDAARSHYYASALPDFESIVATARLRN